ncbi:cysteine proteinase [Meira miltonrushii]|uniref:Cysteine proteinase n=1 Tax=Meira miltonrushii TaxID=1280837 RepID=A0A316VBP2_9BASI|nr:cysteine proteinase [Meira miltonrushii]PWN34724.1 cysteine proteinase [Meira miltonrushii]
MPPRRTKRSAATVEAEEETNESHLNGQASTSQPAKRARISEVDGNATEEAQPPAPTELESEDTTLPPAPPASPPPPPLDDGTDILPPPPPPDEGDTERLNGNVTAEQEQDEEAIGGADYWAKLANEEASAAQSSGGDLYLDTINRSLLDFDFEKLCSISLSNINVYACLVCGKYFQGRGPNSYAYLHSINESHRVFINLESAEVYVLPDNYKVKDASLADIRYLLHPTYSEKHIKTIDAPDAREALDLRANSYLPGFVGLNNLGANDYMNVIIQALAHVKPLRNFFLRDSLAKSTELVRRFASLMRKIWNPRNFKAQVSPHEFLQEVANASKGRFSITKQGDPIEFLGWLLNKLHTDLGGGGKKNKRSIISDCFMGHVRVESQKVFVRSGIELEDGEDVKMTTEQLDKLDSDGRKEGGQEDAYGNAKFNIDREVKVDRSPFFLLAIDLPPIPVFQDVIEKNIIPQVPIATVLSKYDGVSFQEARGMIRRYKTLRLPPFLILHFKRFTKNNFIEERNRTIVEYPVKGLDLSPYIEDPSLASISTTYDLVANVTLEATAGTVRENAIWRSQDANADVDDDDLTEEEKWFSIQDLLVESIDKQLLFLGESYIQIWARRG